MYEAEALVSIEEIVPSIDLLLQIELTDPYDQNYYVEALEEKRHNVERKWVSYQTQINKDYNNKVRPRTLGVGDLVPKTAGHI